MCYQSWLVIIPDLGTTIIRFTEVSWPKKVAHLCKEEVSSTKPQAHGEEQPTIERHGHKHEEVAGANLDNMEERLQNVHADLQSVALQAVNRWRISTVTST